MPQNSQDRNKHFYGAIVSAATAFVVISAWFYGALDTLENYSWDIRVRALAEPSDSRIKLILLDQSSLDWGKEVNAWSWPWPREVYGALLSFFRASKAKTMAFDVLFTEPSPYGLADDHRLGEELAKSPGAILAVVPSKKMGDSLQWPAAAPNSPFFVAGLDAWLKENPEAKWQQPRATFSLPEIISGVYLQGHVRGEVDSDYVTRRAIPLQVFDSNVIPLLGLAAYAASPDIAQSAVAAGGVSLKIENDTLYVGEKSLPLDSHGRTVLRYRQPNPEFNGRSHKSYSMAAVIESALLLLQGEEPPIRPEEFKDSYLFVGFSAPALYDLKPTPFDKAAPGVIAHATLLDNLLNQDAIAIVPPWRSATLIVLLSMLGAFTGLLSFSAIKLTSYFVLLLLIPSALGFAAYAAGFWLPIVAPTIAVAFSCMGSMMINYSTEGRQRRFIKRAFEHYLSPIVIAQIVADPSRLTLGGERREISVFFSDLEGFSRISEKLDATDLTQLLNNYLTEMTEIILDEGGTLDKYEGDAIIAFWNAPLEQPDHSLRACRAALRCQKRLAEKRAEYQQRTGAVLKMRIGVHTGIAVVGNLGSQRRFDYTILGDAVNLASRLEGANKNFGTYLMVSQKTLDCAALHCQGAPLKSRCIGEIRVMGRDQAEKVYELIDSAEHSQENLMRYEKARGLFLEQRWEEAKQEFSGLGEKDALATSYIGRIESLKNSAESNSADSWDGIWSLTAK